MWNRTASGRCFRRYVRRDFNNLAISFKRDIEYWNGSCDFEQHGSDSRSFGFGNCCTAAFDGDFGVVGGQHSRFCDFGRHNFGCCAFCAFSRSGFGNGHIGFPGACRYVGCCDERRFANRHDNADIRRCFDISVFDQRANRGRHCQQRSGFCFADFGS